MNTVSPPSPSGRRGLRLLGLMRKEFLQIRRDLSSIAIAFLLPLLLLLLFGYGVSLDAKHVRLALVADAPAPATTDFFAAFQHSEYFLPGVYADFRDAQAALDRREVSAIVRLPQDSARRVERGTAALVQVILDGVDANTARLLSGYIQGASASWLQRRAAASAGASIQPIQMQARIWFNPAVRSRDYLVPGLIAIIMTLIKALLTAMVVAREWDRGTLEAILATPVSVGEMLIGKIAPYYLLGMGGMLLSVAVALFLFEVPLRGSLWVLLLTGTLFLLTALGMELCVSTIARNQFVAGQVAIIVTPFCRLSCSPAFYSTSTACLPPSKESPTWSPHAISSPSCTPYSWPVTCGR